MRHVQGEGIHEPWCATGVVTEWMNSLMRIRPLMGDLRLIDEEPMQMLEAVAFYAHNVFHDASVLAPRNGLRLSTEIQQEICKTRGGTGATASEDVLSIDQQEVFHKLPSAQCKAFTRLACMPEGEERDRLLDEWMAKLQQHKRMTTEELDALFRCTKHVA